MLTQSEIEERQHHVSNAIASQRLEGIEPDIQTLEDLNRFASGDLELSDVLFRLQERTRRVEIHN
ncbi:hypothetical protein AB204_11185 [Xenorhabdus khoisanae]|uniref:Antitoxin VbhA domain-containing protein n=1 Tax=Xenorhabdus khoisanae TaxID=880157 RepID=A0A0J5FRX3_9GAMM|nr:antitoxin VbhA family protein [Xenorhabdus khoisanae]KMJ45026.1 hypothetical protein AB204_11185 [Xenorhabdus khoisanae]